MRGIILLKIKQKLAIFFEFVELRTKVASVFPMLAGFLWTYYRLGRFNWVNAGLFALAVLSFDMCTTAINNAVDYHKAVDLDYKTSENVIGVHQLDFGQMVRIIFGLLAFSVLVSLVIVSRTDVLLLVLGGLCFLIGIGYTYGPMPLSRLPLGEVFSGLTMGFGIFFLAVYMTAYDQLLWSRWTGGMVTIGWNWALTLELFCYSLPLVSLIAGIMLANNTCDLEVDIRNHRFTLVYYLGKARALALYTGLQILPWLVLLGLALTGRLPLWGLVTFVGLALHWPKVAAFRAKQVKRETFVLSVQSFVLVASLYCVWLLLGILLP